MRKNMIHETQQLLTDQRYLDIARNRVVRPIALSMTRDAFTPAWERGGADPGEMRKTISDEHSNLEASYELSKRLCEEGDADACEEQAELENTLAVIIQQGDRFSDGEITKQNDKILPVISPTVRLYPYED